MGQSSDFAWSIWTKTKERCYGQRKVENQGLWYRVALQNSEQELKDSIKGISSFGKFSVARCNNHSLWQQNIKYLYRIRSQVPAEILSFRSWDSIDRKGRSHWVCGAWMMIRSRLNWTYMHKNYKNCIIQLDQYMLRWIVSGLYSLDVLRARSVWCLVSL